MSASVDSLAYWHRRTSIAASRRRLTFDHGCILAFLWLEVDLPDVYELTDAQADHAEALIRQLEAGDYDPKGEPA